jgi:ABC-type lipoprotein export system ATPase subunit
MDILTGLHKEGKTVILVTHDPKIAEYAHRTIQLEDGRVVGS